jgi:ferrochelatase
MSEAVLLVSHGTVDSLDDLTAFVTNVRRGQAPPPGLVVELRRRYEVIGGRSPLNAVNAEIAGKLQRLLQVRVAWASRLWKPTVRDVIQSLVVEGVERVAMVPLAQHSAPIYAADARRAAEGLGVALACAPNWGQSPALCAAFASRIAGVLTASPDASRTTLVMSAHSLPRSVVDAGDPYEREMRTAAEAIAGIVKHHLGREVHWTVAFQSQGTPAAGNGSVGWLGPDLKAALDDIQARGDRHVVVAPVGFLADHVEILYDLDIEARSMAIERGLSYARSPSLNADGDLVEAIAGVARPLLRHD